MHGRFFKIILLAALALGLGGASIMQGRLNRARAELKLTRAEPLQNAPPVLAFTTVALGGFRGLIANVLWIRTTDLQMNDQFHEAVQLAGWITKLQPRMATVWIHQAWNMAYNISRQFPEDRDRWPWVRRGLELLRDEGLRYNPDDPQLYRELAYQFQHKLGGNQDKAHFYYKKTWAAEMTEVFGGPRPNFDELIDPQTDDAKRRAALLREKYKLDPRRMKAVDARHGPLEWRLPESHAIYWAAAGLEIAPHDESIQLRRVLYQSMDLAARRGRIVTMEPFEFGPNLALIPKANAAYEQLMADDADFRAAIGVAHDNFLKNAVAAYYTNNREAEARKMFDYACKKYPGFARGFDLDEFVLIQVTSQADISSVDKMRVILQGLLGRSFYCLALGEDDMATSYAGMARKLWLRHEEKAARMEKGRLNLPPYETLRGEVLQEILDQRNPAFSAQLAAQLRTRLGLPAATLAPAKEPK
ncbi:MAG: hypothetical protein HZA89_07575 [Verrucomicrobia bacterium]|nr:hypothetical protein [Verrucomicrobiota bacterium]